MNAQNKKRQAAERALSYVENGMTIGLGTGSTAAEFIEMLGKKVASGLEIEAVPTSVETARLAEAAGIPLTTLDEHPHLDLAVDGADEIDDQLRMIKGGGGALLREKIVAVASDHMIIIADDSKRVGQLGRFPLPVEVVSFGAMATKAMIEAMSEDADVDGPVKLRMGNDGQPFVTDNGNYILDCEFSVISDPDMLADLISLVPGVVENGLFLGLADLAIIASDENLAVLEAKRRR